MGQWYNAKTFEKYHDDDSMRPLRLRLLCFELGYGFDDLFESDDLEASGEALNLGLMILGRP